MITLLSNICPVSKRSRQWRFSEILRRQLFARITLPWFMSVEREKCPSFLSTAPFPAPVLFLRPSPFSVPFLLPLPTNQPSSRVTLNLQRESRFLSSSIGLALIHESLFPIMLLNTPIQCRFQAYYLFFSHLRDNSFELQALSFMVLWPRCNGVIG